MSLEDKQLENYRKRANQKSSVIYFNQKDKPNNFIKTKFSNKSIINRDSIEFKVDYCDNNQLKMILFEKGLLSANCSNPASIILGNLTEDEILHEISITKKIYDKLLELDTYVLWRILFDNNVNFYYDGFLMYKSFLIDSIVSNISYKQIDKNISKISIIHCSAIVEKRSVIKLINENKLFSSNFKNMLIQEVHKCYNLVEIEKFVISVNKDLKNNSSNIFTPKNNRSESQNNEYLKSNVIKPKIEYVKKYRVIENPNAHMFNFFNHDKSLEETKNKSFKFNEDNKKDSWNFEFSQTDKKINKPLYDFEKSGIEIQLNNDAVNYMDDILGLIKNMDLIDENKEIIINKIDEANAFIKKHSLTFKKVSDKKREVQLAFDEFSEKIEEKKFKCLKNNVFDIYDDLIVKKLKFVEIGRKYPNFYLYLSKDEVFAYVKKLIDSDSDFSNKFKSILDCFIKENDLPIRRMYNNVIKTLKEPSYIDKENFNKIKFEYEKSVTYLENLNKLKSYFNNFKKVSFKTFNIESMVEKHNAKLMKEEYIENKSFFDNFNGYKLDKCQRNIVLSDEKISKIIAGAGSGKTSTLLAKIKYLIDYKNVSQDKILCISFSNASVNDLKDKLDVIFGENNIDVFTFHKLGGGILKDNSYEYIPNKHLLHQTIEEYFESYILSDSVKIKRIIDFFNIHNYNSKIDKDDLNLVKQGNLVELRNSEQFETLKNKINQLTDYEFNIKNNNSINGVKTVDRFFVRSFEELIIANFLFINNIEYIYEDNFFKRKNIDPEEGYTHYRPDFYLPDYDIYIEHFGVDRNLEAKHLNRIDREEYKKSIMWKRNIHKKYNSKLIETYSYENWEGNLLKNLEEKLHKNKVEFSKIDYPKIYERLINNKKLDDLGNVIGIIERFINLFKTNGFNINDDGDDVSEDKFNEILKEIKYNENGLKTRNIFLFDIIKDIYDLYVQKEGIDFNDMINNPIKLLKANCELKDYDYIFVDEYQDTSYSRYRLLKEIVDRTNAKLIVVGDDWQSIYSFSGCQIDLFTEFEDYFDYSKEFKIQNNYRNSKDLINVTSKFILKNKSQTEKELKSDKKYPKKPIKLAKYNKSKDFSLIFEDMIKEINYNYPDGEILILGRYNEDFKYVIIPGLFETENFYDYEEVLNKQGFLEIKYLEDQTIKIKFRTIHKSKGLESDNVILIGLKYKDPKGFPSKIKDDSIIQYVLNKTKEDTLYAEERRLFYVALTRSRNNVYLLTHEREPSEFITDLEKIDNENKIEFRQYRFNNGDFNRMDIFMQNKFNKKTPYNTNLKCSKCGKGDIILYKKGTGKGFFRCSQCNFDFGAFNQSPELINTLDYCSVDGCDGLTYIKNVDGLEHKICSYYGKNECNGGEKRRII